MLFEVIIQESGQQQLGLVIEMGNTPTKWMLETNHQLLN